VLALSGEADLHLQRTVLDRGFRYSTGIAEIGGVRKTDRV
jgi:hypothetical protein